MSEDRIERIEREVEELKGLLTSVILSARFRDDIPFESLIAKHVLAHFRLGDGVLWCPSCDRRSVTVRVAIDVWSRHVDWVLLWAW